MTSDIIELQHCQCCSISVPYVCATFSYNWYPELLFKSVY